MTSAEAAPGGDVSLCFFYKAPITDDVTERIQGLQVSASYDCDLSCIEDSLSIAGTVLEEVSAEFVTLHCDNDPDDGDGCELVAGVLLDLDKPVEGNTLPGTDVFRSLFCVDFTVDDGAECGSELGVEFVDGLNGRGEVPVNNLVSINNFDEPFIATACSVLVGDGPGGGGGGEFIRGDCNFNTRVNVADAAAVLSFPLRRRTAPLRAAVPRRVRRRRHGRRQHDGRDLILNHMFIPGEPGPPPPGHVNAGVDPTEDDIGCAATDKGCP